MVLAAAAQVAVPVAGLDHEARAHARLAAAVARAVSSTSPRGELAWLNSDAEGRAEHGAGADDLDVQLQLAAAAYAVGHVEGASLSKRTKAR